MPICISPDLPAFHILSEENIFVMDSDRAAHQDIRPLRVLVLNLMPKKIETECQFLRLLSNTPLQVSVEFLHVSSHISKNTSQNHLATFYRTFSEIRDQYYDGCIITGAPVEHLKFEDVDYWNEICDIMEWTKSHVFPPCTSAGRRLPDCIITSTFPSMTWRRRCSASFRSTCWNPTASCSVALTMCSMRPIPVMQRCIGRTSKRWNS